MASGVELRHSYLMLFTETDLAAVLEVEVRTLQSWRAEGRGPDFVKLGKSVFYRVSDVQAWVEANVTIVRRT